MICCSCGIEFVKNKVWQKFCSERCSCREKLRRRSSRVTGYSRIRNTTRRYSEVIKKFLGCSCMVCGGKEKVEIHHIIPLYLGGKNEMDNLDLLCNSCHLETHRKEKTAPKRYLC